MSTDSINTSRGRVGCSITGDGGVPLLFLHGVGSDRSAWNGQLAFFGRHRKTIAMDMPGYGDSDPIAEGEDPRTAFAQRALALLDALGIDRAHVCGLSLGGVVAIALGTLAPWRVGGLVLADSFACHPEGQAILDRSLAGAAEFGMRGLAESRADALLAQPANLKIRSAVIETMARIDPAAYARAAEAVWLADQRRAAAALSHPTLILYGSEDRITPPPLSEELKSLIAGSALVEIAGAGHLPNLEQPETFNRVLGIFVDGLDEAL